MVADGRLVVAMLGTTGILIWNEVPARSDVPPSMVWPGQPRRDRRGVRAASVLLAFRVGDGRRRCRVADTGNRRVLGWSDGLPNWGTPPMSCSVSPICTPEGRTATVPSWADSSGGRMPSPWWVTPSSSPRRLAGNHRVLGWNGPVESGAAADLVLGQPSFDTAVEFPYRPQGPRAFRFPYAVASSGNGSLFVADTSNNRVESWRTPLPPSRPPSVGPSIALGSARLRRQRREPVGPGPARFALLALTACRTVGSARSGRLGQQPRRLYGRSSTHVPRSSGKGDRHKVRERDRGWPRSISAA